MAIGVATFFGAAAGEGAGEGKTIGQLARRPCRGNRVEVAVVVSDWVVLIECRLALDLPVMEIMDNGL